MRPFWISSRALRMCGMRPLLHSDLHDPLELVLRVQDGLALFRPVRQRLLDVDVLVGGQRVHGHRDVPVVGAADQHGVDVLAVEDFV